jgi:LuxR family maltose regulon positive regulatory protein
MAALAPPAPSGVAASAGSPRTVDALTRRERDVLALLAEQRTDREIAEALFLSLRTVNWHVRSILGKLGVNSRREAVARARAAGVV